MLVLVAAAASARAEAPAEGWEFGARYWISSAMTERSHNAQGIAPGLGNPTSVLLYEDLDAHAVELHARKSFGDRWFIRGNAGVGWIRKGSFDDEDFETGQVKVVDTTSTVKGNRLSYASIDVGRDVWLRGDTTIGLFAGYHYWTERLDAYGLTFMVGAGDPIDESVPVITNEVTWHSLRLGVAGNVRFNPRTRLAIDVAWVPYSEVRDEDSHYLRTSPTDLGPTPNIIMDGRGRGLQLDLELRHLFREQWELGVGLRHWWLRATSGDRFAAGTRLPVNEIESRRTGLTLSITRRW
jgi:hypothetical protein